jgi:hypothetical protein
MAAINLGMPLSSSQGLYWDPEANDGAGARISTHSMLKTFRRCPKQAEFKYVHRLKPKRLGSPLKRGTWVHALLEAYHSGEDWRKLHSKYSAKFALMMDEEKDYYGDMPTEILIIMESYMWHYKYDPWEYIDQEFQLEATLPDGTIYRGKVDALIRNQFGLWLVDHKTHKTLPGLSYRLKDAQSALYLWAAAENGLEVQGFIWNYIRWKAPSEPKIVDLTRKVARLSDAACDTDFPTMYKTIVKYKEEYPTFEVRDKDRDKLKMLQKQRYEFGKPQTSELFRRDVLEKSPDMLERVLKSNITTSNRMHTYDFSDPDAVERVVERSCEYACNYTDICDAELMGGNMKPLMKSNYLQGDPNDYYQDKAGDFDKEEK